MLKNNLNRINRYLFLLMLFLLSIVKTINTTIGPDFYWYLEDGKFFWEHKTPLNTNIYSFLPQKRTISHSFGFSVLLYKFYSTYKIKRLYVLTAFFLVPLFFLMILLAYRPYIKIMEFLIIYLGSFLLVFWGTTLRPHLLTYIFTLILLLLYNKDKFFPSVFILPIWSFFHGGVIFGIFLLITFAIDYVIRNDLKKMLYILAYTLLGVLLIVIINPYGIYYFAGIFPDILKAVLFRSNYMNIYISEWQSLPHAFIYTHQMYYVIAFLDMLVLTILFLTSKSKKNSPIFSFS